MSHLCSDDGDDDNDDDEGEC